MSLTQGHRCCDSATDTWFRSGNGKRIDSSCLRRFASPWSRNNHRASLTGSTKRSSAHCQPRAGDGHVISRNLRRQYT